MPDIIMVFAQKYDTKYVFKSIQCHDIEFLKAMQKLSI